MRATQPFDPRVNGIRLTFDGPSDRNFMVDVGTSIAARRPGGDFLAAPRNEVGTPTPEPTRITDALGQAVQVAAAIRAEVDAAEMRGEVLGVLDAAEVLRK